MKIKEKEKKRKNYFYRIIFSYNISILIVGLIFFPAAPILLNYPPHSINNAFQVEVAGIEYKYQYLLLVLGILVIFNILFAFLFKKFSSIPKTDDIELIKTTRRFSFNFPILLFIVETIIPPFLTFIGLSIINTDISLNIRISALVFSITTLVAIISYILCKKIFSSFLTETSNIYNDNYGSLRFNMNFRFFIQFIPVVLCTILFCFAVFSASSMRSNSQFMFSSYKQILTDKYEKNYYYSVNDVKQILENIDFGNEIHNKFILDANGNIVFTQTALTDFFIKYILTYYDISDGQSYDYYGSSIEGALTKINVNGSDYYVGVQYKIFSENITNVFIYASLIILLLTCIFILYFSNNIKKDIAMVTSNLNDISRLQNNTFEHALPITSNDELSDLVIAFNKIQHLTKQNIDKIHSNQDMLIEKERLATLGQMIGGIAHNLKTPIMSISGAAEGMQDLVTEYESSINDPDVTYEDHLEIANDMKTWISKIKTHTAYMSDIISAVKGQTVTFSGDNAYAFSLEELIKRVNILMRHELKNSLIELNVSTNADMSLELHGDINSLVQVINNIISNAIQSYNGLANQVVDLIISKNNNNLTFSIKDYGVGMSKEIQKKLFKEMITTKGKNGTGLGLFMSYSNIRGHFNGKITFESEEGKGTTFNIILPLK